MHFVSSCRKIKLSTTKAIYFDMPFSSRLFATDLLICRSLITLITLKTISCFCDVMVKVMYPTQVSLTEDGITHVLCNWRMKRRSKCSFFTANPCVQLWNEVLNFNQFFSFFFQFGQLYSSPARNNTHQYKKSRPSWIGINLCIH